MDDRFWPARLRQRRAYIQLVALGVPSYGDEGGDGDGED